MNPRRRRLGFALAGAIAALAGLIAVYPQIQDAAGAGDLSGPSIVPRPIVIALLLGLPAALAALAAAHGSRPIFIAAGVLCLFQAFVSFGGVTFGFLLPAILLIAIGVGVGAGGASGPSPRPREMVAGVLVVGLGIAAWIAPFVNTETVCWVARPGPDGDPVYMLIPPSDSLTVGVGELGSGCDGGSLTVEGLLLGGVLATGALAMAGLGARTADRPRNADGVPV